MQPSDRPEFLKILNGLAAIKRVQLTPEALGLWWNAMQAWSLDDFRAGASYLIRSCQFMPTPFDFEQLCQAGRETAAEAWVRVVRESPRWRQGQPGDQNPLVDACIRAVGGNERIALTDYGQLHWLQKKFMEAYEELRDAHQVREAVPQIAGHTKLTNLIATAGQAVALPKAGDR